MLHFPNENEQEFVECRKKPTFPTEQLHIIHQRALLKEAYAAIQKSIYLKEIKYFFAT